MRYRTFGQTGFPADCIVQTTPWVFGAAAGVED
jgi:hypothetical protein